MPLRLLSLSLFVSFSLGASAQTTLPLDSNPPVTLGGTFLSNVPSPEAAIGHRIGSRHTRAHQIRDYFLEVDRVSDRVQVWQYGRSHDRRPLIYAAVSSPANMARIEEIRRLNLKLSEDPGSI
nr:hypothetical protein [Fimbriimonadaceae bacterium]